MKPNKIILMYYQFKKVPKVGNISFKFGWSIHEVINKQCGFESDIKHHNDLSYLRLIYSNYKKGIINKNDFLSKVENRNYVNRYLKHFK